MSPFKFPEIKLTLSFVIEKDETGLSEIFPKFGTNSE
jgi:hypothetical protein